MYLCVSRQSATEERGGSSLPDKEGSRLKSLLQSPIPPGGYGAGYGEEFQSSLQEAPNLKQVKQRWCFIMIR